MREGKKVTGRREKMELLNSFFASVFMQRGKNYLACQRLHCGRQKTNTGKNMQGFDKATPICFELIKSPEPDGLHLRV